MQTISRPSRSHSENTMMFTLIQLWFSQSHFLEIESSCFPLYLSQHLCGWTWHRFNRDIIKFIGKQHYWVAVMGKRCFAFSVAARCSHSMAQIKGDKLRLGWRLGSWLISHCLCDVLNAASTCSHHLMPLLKCKGSQAHELPLLPADCAQWICRAVGVWWIWGENNSSSWTSWLITQWLSMCLCQMT